MPRRWGAAISHSRLSPTIQSRAARRRALPSRGYRLVPRVCRTVLALDLDMVETVFQREPHDLGPLGLGRPVGDQRQPDAALLERVDGFVRVGEQRNSSSCSAFRRRPMRHRSPRAAPDGRPPRARQRRSRRCVGARHRCGGASICAAPDRPIIRSKAASIAAAITVAAIGLSWSAKAAMVRCHCDCAGPNATRIVSSRWNRIARGNFINDIIAGPPSSMSCKSR